MSLFFREEMNLAFQKMKTVEEKQDDSEKGEDILVDFVLKIPEKFDEISKEYAEEVGKGKLVSEVINKILDKQKNWQFQRVFKGIMRIKHEKYIDDVEIIVVCIESMEEVVKKTIKFQ